MCVDDVRELFDQGAYASLARWHIELKPQHALPQVFVVKARVISEHVEHIESSAGVVNEMVMVLPVNRGHDVSSLVVLGQMDEPVVSVTVFVTDEERRKVLRTAVLNERLIEGRLDKKPPISIGLLDLAD